MLFTLLINAVSFEFKEVIHFFLTNKLSLLESLDVAAVYINIGIFSAFRLLSDLYSGARTHTLYILTILSTVLVFLAKT